MGSELHRTLDRAGGEERAGLQALVLAQRDTGLALPGLAGDDAAKKAFMLERLTQAQSQKLKGAELQAWLERAASGYRPE